MLSRLSTSATTRRPALSSSSDVSIFNFLSTSGRVEALRVSSRSVTGRYIDKAFPSGCYFKHPRNGKLAIDEAAATQRAASVTQSIHGARAVRVLQVDKDNQLLYFEEIQRPVNLLNLLQRSIYAWIPYRRLSGPHASALGASLGRWLRAFHDGTAAIVDASEYVNKFKACTGRLRAIERLSPGYLNCDVSTKVSRFLATADATAIARTARVSLTHGDLNLSNVLYENATGDLVVIDFGDQRIGLSLEDVVTVWHTVLCVGANRGKLCDPAEAFATHLWDAYGAIPETDSLVKLVRIMCALRCIQSYLEFARRWTYRNSWTGHSYRRIADNSRRWLKLLT